MLTRYQGFTIISSLLLAVVVSILLSLGFWQLSRMTEKQSQLEALSVAARQARLPFSEVLNQANPVSGTPVFITGDVNTDKVWLLDNQFFDSQLGYKVFATVNVLGGNVLVDFGWVKGDMDRAVFPKIELPKRLVKLEAVLAYSSENVFVDDGYTETNQQGDMQLNRIQAITALAQPFYLVATQDSAQFKREYKPVVMPPEKHLAYAIQWFGIAIAAAVIGFIALRKSKKHQ